MTPPHPLFATEPTALAAGRITADTAVQAAVHRCPALARSAQRFIVILLPMAILFASMSMPFNVALGDVIAEPQADAQQRVGTIPVGIDGIYRAGQWTAIKRPATLVDRAAVQTLDGEGVKVVYEQPVTADSPWLYAVPGSTGVPLVIKDAAGIDVQRGKFVGKSIEPKMPWVVVFGDPLGVEDIGRNDLLGRESSVAVSRIRTGSDFPDQAMGLFGVDLLIMGPSGIAALRELTPQQGSALVTWVRRGGRVIISLGKDAKAIFAAAPWLHEIVSVNVNSNPIRLDPAAIETFTSSQSPLSVLDATELPVIGGHTRIAGRNSARQPARIAVEYNINFGRVTVVAPALDAAEFAKWPERSLLISRLCGGLFESEQDVRRDNRAITSIGYDDIAGQIRAALDRFESRRRIPFSVISLILMALVAMIGPLDYLLVNRFFGRPLLGWISFPLSVLLISGLLIAIGRPEVSASNPNLGSAHVNRIEISDIDTTSDLPLGRGWSWTHVSANDATKANFSPTLSADFYTPHSQHPLLSAPFGYSGSTFGGISIVGEDVRLPAYRVAMSLTDGNEFSSQINSIPLAPGGSKGIVSRWTFTPQLAGISDLSRRRGSELLAGSVTNPLPVDVFNGALVFGEWVYLLPTRFRAGQSIDNIETLRQKNFRWLLSRREAIENSSRSEPWNVEMHDDFVRLSELLMFNSICGGRDYTGLTDRPLGDLDLSYILNQETAMLYGQIEKPTVEIDLPVQRDALSTVRVLLKVALPKLDIDAVH